MAKSKKKVTTAIVAGATAAALLLGGTFAWQSINQTALNEASDVINPGGRLHDDYNGTNKDVYVENFADEAIFARVRLDEYFEIVMNKGTGAEKIDVITDGAVKGDLDTYVTHIFGDTNVTDGYWEWTTGGSTVYMPTFNMNKDSLAADINGTYAGPDEDPDTDDDRYTDYVEYTNGQTLDGQEIYDADTNDLEDENVKEVAATHTATTTLGAELISMEQWITEGSNPGAYWVYDTDGWVYWAQAIQPDTATGLLLDEIGLTQVMDDSWYYAINVVAQFVTADDLGRGTGTGFYDLENGTAPSKEALELLKAIGVDTTSIVSDVAGLREAFANGGDILIDGEISTDETEGDLGNNPYNYLWHTGGTVEGGTLTTSGPKFGLFINNEMNWPNAGDGASAATINGTTFNGSNSVAVYTQAIDAPIVLNDVKINASKIGLYSEYTNATEGVGTVTLNNCTIISKNEAADDKPWQNSAVAVAKSGTEETGAGHVIINSGYYKGDYAAYVYSSGGTIEINGGHFEGKLGEDAGNLIIKGGTFTVDPIEFVDTETYEVVDNGDGTWNVKTIGSGEESPDVSGLTSFANTDDLNAPPYVVFTANENGDGISMYFVRTYDDITTNPSEHTVKERTVTEVYLGTNSWYDDTGTYETPWGVANDDYTYDTELVTDAMFINKMQPISTRYWFWNMPRLKTITGLNKLDTSKCTNMRGMFQGASALEALDVSQFDTSLVTDMADMFSCVPCEVKGIERLNTSQVTDMSWMFNSCTWLNTVDLSGWNVAKCKNFGGMFYSCSNLSSITGAAEWDTSSVESMFSMFCGCSSLQLDCSGWNVNSVNDFNSYYCFNDGASGVISPEFPQ